MYLFWGAPLRNFGVGTCSSLFKLGENVKTHIIDSLNQNLQVVRNPIIEKQSKDGKPVVEYQEEELLVICHFLFHIFRKKNCHYLE